MKKQPLIIGLILLVIIALWGISKYNGLVNLDESVKSQWGNVQNQYQRRADLIPNLVSTVKGYATHVMNPREVSHATRYHYVTLVFNRPCLRANPHTRITVLRVGEEWDK